MLIFAHRGASGDAPENTLKAMRLALQQGCDGIEIDIHQVDEEFVVIHDRWLQRTTNGKGLVSTQTLEQLRAWDAGEGERIPTLAEILDCIANRCLLNIELKGVEDADTLISYIHSYRSSSDLDMHNLLFSSFDHHHLKRLKTLEPSWRIGALTASNPISYAEFAQQLDADTVNIDVNVVDKAFVEDAKHRGLDVYVYTVDQPEELKRLHSMGVDGVFANFPARAREALTR